MDRELAGEEPNSYPYFARMWKKHRSTVKPKTGGTFMKCHPCTLFKETRFGAPGIRATTDPAVLADAKTAHEKHLKVRRSIVYIVYIINMITSMNAFLLGG